MNSYIVKTPTELSEEEIKTILEAWDVEEWKNMNSDEFKTRFDKSEFHLLADENAQLLSVARINHKFRVKIGETVYQISELVGFVAIVILHEYGKTLLSKTAENLKSRNIEAIGFCRKRTSRFYETTGFNLFYDKVKFIREWKDGAWFTPVEDDHIVSVTLGEKTSPLFENLSDENPAYLLFE